MTPHIRTAEEADADILRSYAERLFSEDLPGIFRRPIPTIEEEREFIRSRTEPANSTLLLAEDEFGRIVGLLDFEGGSIAEERHAGTFGLSVDREYRGRGVGTALLEALFSWAPDHGIRRIQAWAWASNPRAIRLYERMGFVREGVAEVAIVRDGRAVDAVMLARVLPQGERVTPSCPAALELNVAPGTLAICRLSGGIDLPSWVRDSGAFTSVTWTSEETSVVCPMDAVPEGVVADPGWRALAISGPLDLDLKGVMASVSQPLADADISMFVVSTYDTDYILVRETALEAALNALEHAGHQVRRPH